MPISLSKSSRGQPRRCSLNEQARAGDDEPQGSAENEWADSGADDSGEVDGESDRAQRDGDQEDGEGSARVRSGVGKQRVKGREEDEPDEEPRHEFADGWAGGPGLVRRTDRKSTRLNSSHVAIS